MAGAVHRLLAAARPSASPLVLAVVALVVVGLVLLAVALTRTGAAR